ncbi:O-antigen ligase [Hoeflea halophila]|uniref:O-antigen ligase n=1 Tax=Hoeflea halophila TaxID=714899 RepID=A0A286IE79_9HYPH|nr:O-antigen ligase family protein [Hoeflea halophila]SOE17956.1 O-antigen ligase [Hoeflea halophila]
MSALSAEAHGLKSGMVSLLASLGLMVFLAASLSVPGGYSIGTAMIAVAGLVFLARRLVTRARLIQPTLAGKLPLVFMAFALVGAAISLWQRAPAGHYEMYIPFLWAPLIFLAVLDSRIDRRFVWLGCLIGAALACAVALHQSVYLGQERPSGFLTSPIFFGNNSLLLGSVALAGRHDPPFKLPRSVWLALSYAGFFLGFAASLTTLSKAGWPFAPLVLVWVVVEDFWHATKREKLSIVLVVVAIAALLPLMPVDRYLDRINSAATGALEWFHTGEMVEGSVAPRLELWKLGLTIWPEKPWLGHTREGVSERIEEVFAHDQKSPQLSSLGALHSEPIQLLAEKGLFGLLSWVLMYVAPALVFWRAYSGPGQVRKVLGQAGLFTLIGSFVFGLSDTYLIWNVNRQIFVFLVMTMAALLLLERNKSA